MELEVERMTSVSFRHMRYFILHFREFFFGYFVSVAIFILI